MGSNSAVAFGLMRCSIGTITGWKGGVSAKCQIHGGKFCNVPRAPGAYPSDNILINWLLLAVDLEGNGNMSLADHMAAKPEF